MATYNKLKICVLCGVPFDITPRGKFRDPIQTEDVAWTSSCVAVWQDAQPILKPRAMPNKDGLYETSKRNIAGLERKDFSEHPLDIKGPWYYYDPNSGDEDDYKPPNAIVMYPMHSACWDILQQHHESHSPGLPLDGALLADFFARQPQIAGRRSAAFWSTTNYGGAEYIYDAEEMFSCGSYLCRYRACEHALPGKGFSGPHAWNSHVTRFHDPKWKPDAFQNYGDYLIVDLESVQPLETISRLVVTSREELPSKALSPTRRSGDDIFSKLPSEIRTMILCFLPLEYGYNLRLASRSVAVEGLNPTFLRSRFIYPHELCHIPSSSPLIKNSEDLISLCRWLFNEQGPGFEAWRNRKRVSNIMLELAKILIKGKPFPPPKRLTTRLPWELNKPPAWRHGFSEIPGPKYLFGSNGRILDMI